MVVYDVGETGNAARVWNRLAMEGRRVKWSVIHCALCVALDPDAKLANVRTQGSERLVDISLGGVRRSVRNRRRHEAAYPCRGCTDAPLIGDAPIDPVRRLSNR